MLHNRRSLLCASIALCALPLLTLAAGTVQAQTSAYSVEGFTYEGQVGQYTLGFNFKPTVDIYITALGEFVPNDAGGPGTIQNAETLGIFDSVDNLLFSTDFTQANALLTSNTLASGSQFRYTDVTSINSTLRLLKANTEYTVAGTSTYNTYSTDGVNIVSDPLISITSLGLADSGDTINGVSPTRPTGFGIYSIYGTNFLFTIVGSPTSVPEPGSLALLIGIGASGGTFLLRRKRLR